MLKMQDATRAAASISSRREIPNRHVSMMIAKCMNPVRNQI
jgi:hypothetical protein